MPSQILRARAKRGENGFGHGRLLAEIERRGVDLESELLAHPGGIDLELGSVDLHAVGKLDAGDFGGPCDAGQRLCRGGRDENRRGGE